MVKVQSLPSIHTVTSTRERLLEFLVILGLFGLTAGVYSFLFNRSNVLSHSIGYNLYASERVLEGAVPYRDFHTLYPPATFYLNALFFRWLGISLHSALLGVMVFKVLTAVAIYLSGREIMPRIWALAVALPSVLWLRPNGPFKSVPMHYGALFLALALYLLLKHEKNKQLGSVFLAGASLGLVALFKHNIGAYALAGSLVWIIFENVNVRQLSHQPQNSDGFEATNVEPESGRNGIYQSLMLLTGFAVVVLPALIFMQANHALQPMIRTMLFGPGEFLLSRLAVPLSPVAPLVLLSAVAVATYASNKLRTNDTLAVGCWLALLVAISVFLLFGSQSDVNQIIFYLPMFVLGSGLLIGITGKQVVGSNRRSLLIVSILAAASLMELFPRFAREQSIAAMPFVLLALFYLLYLLSPVIREFVGGSWQYRLALAVLPVTFTIIEGRLFFNTYFENSFGFKAATSVSVERGRGAYFPAATATMIDKAVRYIQDQVDVDSNAFAQSDAGTSLLFLANRRNVSNAQFWVGVGVTEGERAATLDRIDKSQTKLIITSDEVLAAEKYDPMRDYIERNFKPTVRFDEVLLLERRTN
ncbi:MAG TPA: glycosyltransferase family 39 protein [Blastocatellia bacterium]|nr:glycosyltransferase family 39 protein [Blastocatellia bacterium]